MTTVRLRLVAAIGVFVLSSLGTIPARSGPAEVSLLASYIGNWSGSGDLQGADPPESFRCRLNIAQGKLSKINYSGRCTLVNMNLSVAGTIAFDDAANHYQAAMTSNAGFTGYAVGVPQGNEIVFDLAEKQTDRTGNEVRIGSKIHLAGGSITVDFQVEFNNSGKVLTAVVPFSK